MKERHEAFRLWKNERENDAHCCRPTCYRPTPFYWNSAYCTRVGSHGIKGQRRKETKNIGKSVDFGFYVALEYAGLGRSATYWMAALLFGMLIAHNLDYRSLLSERVRNIDGADGYFGEKGEKSRGEKKQALKRGRGVLILLATEGVWGVYLWKMPRVRKATRAC